MPTPTLSERTCAGPKPVLKKTDFVRRYTQSYFGNAAPSWNTLQEFKAARYNDLVHIRNRVAGGNTWYNVEPERVEFLWNTLVKEMHVDPAMLYISAMAPTAQTTLQGEVQRSERHLDLRYTQVRLPMREALAVRQEHVSGLRAQSLLLTHLCSNSYGWLMDLLDDYPDHVVEFSSYEKNWGTIPGFNTVFWECRLY